MSESKIANMSKNEASHWISVWRERVAGGAVAENAAADADFLILALRERMGGRGIEDLVERLSYLSSQCQQAYDNPSPDVGIARGLRKAHSAGVVAMSKAVRAYAEAG